MGVLYRYYHLFSQNFTGWHNTMEELQEHLLNRSLMK